MAPGLIPPKNIKILANVAIAKTNKLAREVSQYLAEFDISTHIESIDFDKPNQNFALENCDMVIALGGDGTILRAGHKCAPLGLPLLGIHAGRFGFLVELAENDWRDRLKLLTTGDYRLENRMMLQVEFFKSGTLAGCWNVINELVVCRGQYVRPIEVRVDLNEGYLTSYMADGLIVSTATGSTAYALAAGGPILPPELRNILLVPIAPHLSLDRAVVLAEGASVCIQVYSNHETVISVDGQDSVMMRNADLLRVTSNPNSLKMVRFSEPNYFYRRISTYMENNPITKLNNNGQN